MLAAESEQGADEVERWGRGEEERGEDGEEDEEEQGGRTERSRWKRKAEVGCPGGGPPRASVGGPGHGLLVPCEKQQPPALCPQLGLPPCCWPPPPLLLPSEAAACLPARRPRWVLECWGGGGWWKEGGREEGRQEEGREEAESKEGGRGIGGGGARIGWAGGPPRGEC